MATANEAAGRSPAQWFAFAFGIVYVLIGLIGFAVTGFDGWFENTDEQLIIFDLNPAHNVVNILLGAMFLFGSRAHHDAKLVNTLLGAAFLLVFVLGLVGALRWLSIDDAAAPDNYLHLVSGIAALYFGTAGASSTRSGTENSGDRP